MYHGLLEFICPDCLVAQKATGVSPPPSSYMVGESAEGTTEPATARILSRGCPDAPLPEKTQGGGSPPDCPVQGTKPLSQAAAHQYDLETGATPRKSRDWGATKAQPSLLPLQRARG